MLRNSRTVYGCCHGACCEAKDPNRTLRTRERRAWQREAREARDDRRT